MAARLGKGAPLRIILRFSMRSHGVRSPVTPRGGGIASICYPVRLPWEGETPAPGSSIGANGDRGGPPEGLRTRKDERGENAKAKGRTAAAPAAWNAVDR